MRRLILWLCFVMMSLILPGVYAQTVTDVYITPTSGPAGTPVTVFNTHPTMPFQCFAGTVDLGYVPAGGSVVYVIPPDATPDTLIDFRCYITSVDVTDSVGLFYVQPPTPVPAPDSDGDALPDNQDACPFEFAQTPNGCPAATPPAQPTLELFPNEGPCLVSAGASTVNVREGPAADATVLDQLAAGMSEPVLLITSDRSWVQIAAGWVSTSVTRTSGDCSGVPVLSVQGISAETPARIAQQTPLRYDVLLLVAECSELMDQVASLTFQALLTLIGIEDDVQRCDEARRLIQRAAFTRMGRSAIEDDQTFTVWQSTICWQRPDEAFLLFNQTVGSAAANYNMFVRTLLRVDPDLADAHFRNPGNAESSFNRTWSLGPGFDIACDVLRLNRARIGDYGAMYNNVSRNGLMTLAVLTCPEAWTLPTERLRVTIIQLIQAGFDQVALLRDSQGCNLINEVHLLGTLSSLQLTLFAVLVQQCGYRQYRQPIVDYFSGETLEMSAANVVAFADVVAADLERMLRFTDGFCSQPLDIIRSWGASGAVQRAAAREESSLEFRTPSAFQDCPSTWRRIRRRGDDLSPAALLSLLRSANPCQVGYVWATANTPIPINLGEAARCFTGIPISIPVPPAGVGTYQIGGELPVTPETPFGALVYSSASILTERTPFVIKFNAVDRPDTEICPELPIPLLEIVLTPTLDFTSGDFAVIDPSAIDAATILATPTAAPLPGGSSATATPLVSPAPPPLMSPTSTPGSAEVVVPPLSAADAADMDAALEELLTESALPTGALGVFQAAANGATAHDLYLLSAGGVLPLTPGSLDDEQVPALDTHGQRVAYVAIGSDGLISIRMIDISTGGTSVLFTATPDLAPSLVAPAWSPVTPLLFVTLVNPAGEPGIYAIDVSDPSRIPSPTLLIANASSPAITVDGGYLAFSQGTSTRRDLVVMDLVSGISFPLSSPAEGVLCDHPAFDFTGVTLYFACVDTTTTNTTTIYRYQLNDLLPVPIAGELIGRFDAGPTLNIVTVSNGESILVSSFSDSEGALTPVAEVPLVELEGYTISHFRWRAYRADPSPSR